METTTTDPTVQVARLLKRRLRDDILMERLIEGDQDAFVILWSYYGRWLAMRGRRRGLPPEEIEKILHQVAIRMWRYPQTYIPTHGVAAWVKQLSFPSYCCHQEWLDKPAPVYKDKAEQKKAEQRRRGYKAMAQLAVGNHEGFNVIWKEHYQWLSVHLYKKGMIDQEAIQDTIQDLSLKVMRLAHKYDRQIATVGTWFALILDNLNWQHWQKRRRRSNFREIEVDDGRHELTSQDDQFEGPVSGAETKRILRVALRQLPPMLSAPINMRFFDGLQTPEIAARLHIDDPAVVNSRIARGLAEIKKKYGTQLRELRVGVIKPQNTIPRIVTRYFEE
jgi:RNA polymerase sigma factor (sigma-70 family)